MLRYCRPRASLCTGPHAIPQLASRWPIAPCRRLASTTSRASNPSPKMPVSKLEPKPSAPQRKTMFPERLIIYHAGTPRTVFLGCLKVTTIFIATFFTCIAAPSAFNDPEQPAWVAPVVMLSGVIPMIGIAYMTSPFVTYIHLRIPQFARNSREMLLRYSKNLNKDAELDVTTMNMLGKPRVARVKFADLYPAKSRFGFEEIYAREIEEINKKRKWWMGRVNKYFGLHTKKSNVKDSEVWENVKLALEKNREKKRHL